MRTAIMVFLFLSIQGCSVLSALDTVNPFKEDNKGINVTSQVGKNNSKVYNKALVQSTVNTTSTDKSTDNSTDQSTNTSSTKAEIINTITENGDSVWLIIAFAVAMGMAIPSPTNMVRMASLKRELKAVRDELALERGKVIDELRKQINEKGNKLNT